ncbi:outer membrane protein assembly factor BamB family protein [Maribacter spongiicola]|uniref:outer membrane protein assembly factor BamB family protein n=1 Tax=Maribacter spongiicola TaxID=1206753 RepID=UPI001FBB5923|nr:PQQ-binding-like beta-propeller repeat protein [Maribacter spongiicola]
MKIILLAFALTITFSTVAQREADEVLTFDNPVKDLLVVPTTGIAVITEGDKIHGYSPLDNKIIWSADAPKRTSLNVISEINMTGGIPGATADFMAIEDTPFVQKFFDDSMYVFNSTNGELLFTNEGKERFFEASYLFDENAFLLRGKEDKNLIIAKYSLGSKEMVWKTTVSTTFGDFMSSLGKLAGAGKEGVYDKLEYSDDKIFALIKNKFYALNKDSGELLWKLEEENIKDFRRSLNGDYVVSITSGGFLGTKSEFDLFEAANGKKVWDKALVTKYLVLFEDWEDKMLLAHYKGFNFYSYKTGEKLWSKDPKGKGIKSVIPIGKDFLYVYDNEMMLLDKNGEKLGKKMLRFLITTKTQFSF